MNGTLRDSLAAQRLCLDSTRAAFGRDAIAAIARPGLVGLALALAYLTLALGPGVSKTAIAAPPGFVLPVHGVGPTRVTDGPGEGRHTVGSAEAIDFAVCNTPVYPTANGRVAEVEAWDGTKVGFGNYVKLVHPAHGNRTSLYAHLNSVAGISVGQEFTTGQSLGTAGSSGASACHLHFEVRDSSGNPIRVLDMAGIVSNPAWNQTTNSGVYRGSVSSEREQAFTIAYNRNGGSAVLGGPLGEDIANCPPACYGVAHFWGNVPGTRMVVQNLAGPNGRIDQPSEADDAIIARHELLTELDGYDHPVAQPSYNHRGQLDNRAFVVRGAIWKFYVANRFDSCGIPVTDEITEYPNGQPLPTGWKRSYFRSNPADHNSPLNYLEWNGSTVVVQCSSGGIGGPNPTDCQTGLEGVILYEHAYFDVGGRCWTLTDNVTDLNTLGGANDNVASIRIVGPYRATLFRDPGLSGLSESFMNEDANLADNTIGTTASSARVERLPCNSNAEGVTLFAQPHWNGACSTFTANDSDLNDDVVGNDNTWSVRIRGPYRATLFLDPNFTGTSETVITDEGNLSDNIVGTGISSIRVERLACDPNSDGVTVFANRDFQGACSTFTADDSELQDNGLNDATLSIRVRGPYRAWLYEHPGFSGNSDVFTYQDANLSDNIFGSGGSSIRVRRYDCNSDAPGLTLFAQPSFAGVCQTFTSDDADIADDAIGNDDTFSARVSDGYVGAVYEHPGFSGASVAISSEIADLRAVGFGTGASSLRILARPAPPDLALTKEHVGSFSVGGDGEYTLRVTNSAGAGPTPGPILITDTLSPGLTFRSSFGSAWNCAVAGQAVTCASPGPLSTGQSSTITLIVGVLDGAVPSVTNSACVSTAGDANAANDCDDDTTSVVGLVPPIVRAPTDGARLSPNVGVRLEWNAVPGAADYLFELVTLPSGPTAQLPTSATSFDLGTLQSGQYSWRVRARNGSAESEWSPSARFDVLANLLSNHGFESGAGNSPASWTPEVKQGTPSFDWDTTNHHSGIRSARLSASSPAVVRWRQSVPLQEDGEYELSGWIKTAELAGGSVAKLATYGQYPSWMSVTSNRVVGSRDWTYVSTRFINGSTANVNVVCSLGEEDLLFSPVPATGTAWCDDVALVRLRTVHRSMFAGQHVALNVYTEDWSGVDSRDYLTYLDETYDAMKALVGSVPYGGQVITAKSEYPGNFFAFAGNPITISPGRGWSDDVTRHGIDFGIPHEIGHDFDDAGISGSLYMGDLRFHNGEHWANLKVLYAFDILGPRYPLLSNNCGGAVIPLVQVGTCFVARHAQPWIDAGRTDYQAMHNDVYTGLQYKLRQQLGWEPFKCTFGWYSRISPHLSPASTELGKVQQWANTLGVCGGVSLVPQYVSWGFPIQNDPPAVASTPQVGNVSTTGATITWTTNELADHHIEFGTTPVLGSASPASAGFGTSHTVTLSGLQAGTTYYFAAISRDSVGNRTSVGNLSFTTSNTMTTHTVTFDDRAGQNQALNGQYPSGIIDWGTNQWYHSAPWRLFTTKSISLRTASLKSATFTFLTPRRLVSIEAFNGGTVSSTVTLSCAGQPTRTVSVAVNQKVNIDTNWTGTCTTVTIGSANGWNTNFDNLVYEQGGQSGDTTPPVISAVSAPSVSGTAATIIWLTDEPSTGQVEYGLTAAYGSSTPIYPALVTAHSISVTGLRPATTYHYRVLSRDGATPPNSSTSDDNTFTTAGFNLVVSKNGTGSGTVVSSPEGISCGTDCAESFAPGAHVTLTPSPGTNSKFDGWSGGCTGATVCTVVMDAAKSVTATFVQTTDLSISISDAPDPVLIGKDLTYSLTVSNAGPATVIGASAQLPVPGGLTLVSAPDCYLAGGVVICDLGTLSAGAAASRTVVVRPSTGGNLKVTATVVGAQDIDRSTTNDSATASTTVAVSQPTTQTETFDDRAGQNQALNGQYPSGIIDWGTNQWYHSAPWRLFTTKSISLRTASLKSATFTFLTPRRLVSIEAFNGGTVSSTVTLSCAGQPTRTVSVAVNQKVNTDTNWTGTCTTVTIGSTNGWNTNFDNLVYDGG